MLEFASWSKSWKYVMHLCTSVVPVFSAMFSFKCSACTEAAIRLLQRIAKYQLYSNSHSLVYSQIQNFENCTQTVTKQPFACLQPNSKFWKLYPNCHSFCDYKYEIFNIVPKKSLIFSQQIKKSKIASKLLFFLTTKYNIWRQPNGHSFFTKNNKNRTLVLVLLP